jgi:hypothetical protein
MVLAAIPAIARIVALASPVVFKTLDATCTALESAAGTAAATASSADDERARNAIVAFRVACETRKALRGRRR